jgi:hypothetical protein
MNKLERKDMPWIIAAFALVVLLLPSMRAK